MEFDWFTTIAALVMCHSPSGAEHEIDQWLDQRLSALAVEHWQDAAGNVIARIPGRTAEHSIAVTAHKDEIGAMVTRVRPSGVVEARKLGGAFPWVWGEGVVDLLGDHAVVHGVLSFGSRHVSHESPQKAQQEDKPLRWEDAWIETKRTPNALQEAGVRPGTRVVIGKHRKAPFRLGDYIASYTLDNKASIAILLHLAQILRQGRCEVYLVFSAREEVGALGALYFSQRFQVDELIALEICPKALEYPVISDSAPVLLAQDGYGLYDEVLNRALQQAAVTAGVAPQFAVLQGFGSDGSLAMKMGHVPKAACLAFPTDNTHGYEIAQLRAIASCSEVLAAYLR